MSLEVSDSVIQESIVVARCVESLVESVLFVGEVLDLALEGGALGDQP
ncbi:hypothetical protein [Mycobacteroides abscessus]|nr:hypothetical protein [Mycobacteroides abscessus]